MEMFTCVCVGYLSDALSAIAMHVTLDKTHRLRVPMGILVLRSMNVCMKSTKSDAWRKKLPDHIIHIQ